MKRSAMKAPASTLFVGILMSLGLAACGNSAPAATPISAEPTATITVEEATAVPTEAVADDWRTFTSDEGGFSIDMPGDPEASNSTAETALGQITFYFYQISDGTAQYAASYNDYPIDISESDVDSLLQDAIDGAAQGNEVQNMQTVEIQGHSAIQGEIAIPNTAHVWYTGVLVDKRLYQVILSAPEDVYTDYTDEAQRFTDSFTLLNP